MAEAILNQPQFQDADKAREYLEALRWANGVTCPHCGSMGAHYKLQGKATRPGVYKCVDCSDQFTVTVGTVFERSKVALNVWLQAVHLMCASKKGISAKQLERMLGVSYKTAWFMAHRIREAMTSNPSGLLGSGGGTVEADETYWGTSQTKPANARGYAHKMKVVSLVEREGKVRSFHVKDVKASTIKTVLVSNVDKSANLMTDEASQYVIVGREFASHESVKHNAGEYTRGKAHTNTIEGYFSIFKRGMIGTFHKCGEQHLQRYVNEFDFRYNSRTALGYSDTDRTNLALKGITGKRLTYRRIDGQQAV